MPYAAKMPGRLIKRQKAATRIAHWLWTACMFFLVLSGLQIFNAHPVLYLGNESGFDYDNALLSLPAFPSALTLPSTRDLATGRVIHFFFAWILVATLAFWLVASLLNRHLRKDLVPTSRDLAKLPEDMREHLAMRIIHRPRYSPLQKLAYASVLFVLFPMIILTGLCMSPGMNAALPFLPELFGGRQGARTVHFAAMVLLLVFFFIHIAMVVIAGPLNEIRSIITGRYRLSARRSGKSPHA
jgi:thiosulfate reductase cytochrome b subunit